MVNTGLKEQQFVVAEVNTRYHRPVSSERFYAVSVQGEQFNAFIESVRQGQSSRTSNRAWVFKQESAEELLRNVAADVDTSAAATSLEAEFATTKI